MDFSQKSLVRFGHDDRHCSPGEHEQEDGPLPEPGGQEDPVFAAQDVAQMSEDVRVSGSLQSDSEARHHEEDVGQDVDLCPIKGKLFSKKKIWSANV